jgi:hypothetical protein
LVVLAVSVINLIMFLYGSVLMWEELKARALLKTETSAPNILSRNGEAP